MISYTYTSNELVKNTSFYQQNLLNQLNKQMITQMNSIEQLSLTTSRNVTLQDYLSLSSSTYVKYRKINEIGNILANLVYSTSALETVELYISDPLVTYPETEVKLKDLDSLLKEEWFPVIRENDFVWLPGREITIKGTEKPVISFVRKVYNNSGQYKGVLVLNMKSSVIRSLMAGDDHDRPSLRLLMDTDGKIIATVGEYPISPEIQTYIHDQVHDSSIGYVPANFGDRTTKEIRDSLIVWSKFNTTNWLLIEITPWKQITHGSMKIALILFIAGIIAIVIALSIIMLVSKQFTKPIRMLVREMNGFSKTYSRSKRSTNFPRDYQNEFGTMFSVYDKMLDQIDELYRSLETRYTRQKETELQTLQAMINPHFLYNTLDQLNWMAIKAGHEPISEVLELMGRMFRIGLSNGEYVIKIADEIEHIRCYMEMQKIRLGDHIAFHVDIPDAILNHYILKLTLQPFVENAVMHGLPTVKQGEIRITATETTEEILVTVADNGCGMREGWQQEKSRKTGGYGIRNVKERMDAYFTDTYSIRIDSEAGRGTAIHILLPKINNPQQWRNQHVETGSR